MADTIRVTVGDSGAGFDLPELRSSQINALNGLSRIRPDRTPFYCLLTSQKFELQESGLIQSVACPDITPLGRAVLAHYEERGG